MPAWVLLSSLLADADAEREAEEQAIADGTNVVDTTEEKEVKREKKRKNGVKVLDSTAAPGNKTTMAAALAGEDGRVVAVERDVGRYKVLKEMCAKAGCSSKFELSPNRLACSTNFMSLRSCCPNER